MRKTRSERRAIILDPISMMFCVSFLITMVLFLSANSAFAQELSARPDRGFGGKGGYQTTDIDSISLQNGTVNLQIPLASLPPVAGGKLSYTLTASYNSKLWDVRSKELIGQTSEIGCQPKYTSEEVVPSSSGGWQIGGQYEIFFREALEDYEYLYPDSFECYGYEFYYMEGRYFKPMIRMPDGSEHELKTSGGYPFNSNYSQYQGASKDHLKGYLRYTGTGDPVISAPIRLHTTDGSFISVVVDAFTPSSTVHWTNPPTWTIYLKDGTRVEQSASGQRIKDNNGNSILLTYHNVKDEQTGREIKWSSSTYNGQPATKIEYQSVGGAWQSVWVINGTTTVLGKLYFKTDWEVHGQTPPLTDTCYSHVILTGVQFNAIREIIFPATGGSVNPQKFTFAYNSDATAQVTTNNVRTFGCEGTATQTYSRTASIGMGELSQVTTPTGAQINYAYVSDGRHDFTEGMSMPEFGNENTKEIVRDVVDTKTLTHDGTTDTWTYQIQNVVNTQLAGGGSVINPDGSSYGESYYPTDISHSANGGSNGLGGFTYRTHSANAMTEKHWTLLGGSTMATGSPSQSTPINAVVDTEYTSLLDTSGNRVLMTAKKFAYDYNGELLQTIEYDWFSPGSVTFGGSYGLPSGVPAGATVLRVTNNSYYNQAADGNSSNAYHTRTLGTSPVIIGKPKETTVGSATVVKSTTRLSYDAQSYGTAPTLGNLTKVSAYNDVSSTWIDTTSTYDSKGNVTSTTDANGNITQITYGSINGYTGLYPTQTVSAYGTSIARTSSAVYDFYTGLAISTTDEDNDITVAIEYDILGRPIKTKNAMGTSLESWGITEYHDEDRFVIVKSDLENVGDGKKVAIQHYDQLGRVRLSRTLENPATEDPTNETHGIKVETRYQTGNPNSYQLSSNPFRAATATAATSEPSMGWTRSKSWNTGRKQEVETFSGATLPAPWGTNANSTGIVTTDIDANTTTVTDQVGKKRRTVKNALGHLTRVDEPNDAGLLDVSGVPVQSTDYTYDVLNNLLTVVQGSQTRTFVYSSLSRMISDTNPESGTINYQFDANGNPTQKTNARGVSTHFIYDALNRVTQKSYSGETGYTTPTVNYTYDAAANAIGRLTRVNNGISENRYTAFDKMGRVLTSQQITDGQTYSSEYVYNLGGALIEQTYPSGRKVKNILDSEGDLSIVRSKKNPNQGYWNYAEHFTYTASGVVSSMQLGNGQWQSTQFNSRLQQTQIASGTTQNATNLLKLEFGYGTTQNNGTLQSQTITVPTVGTNQGFAATQTYMYDSLTRLTSATETVSGNQTWKQTFTFDKYGNRNFDEANTTTLPKNCGTAPNYTVCAPDRKINNPSISTANNRLNASEDYAYDNAGNTTGNPQGHIFKYDGENKQYEVRNAANQAIGQYFFDGGGKRVKKVVPSTGETTVFVYDSTGKMVAEYSTQLSQVQQVSYISGDHLGSPRIKTDQNGAVISRNDYHPYGEDVSTPHRIQGLGYKPDDVRQKFTGYEKDNETGLDFAQARMYANPLGRFTTTDPSRKSINAVNPQTWNRYIYCHNNPLALVDDNGKWPTPIHQRIIDRAFDRMSAVNRMAIKNGSKSVDIEGGDVKTMKESNAPQHAMTPGTWVAEMGLAGAQEKARGAAVDFVRDNLSAARNDFRLRDKVGHNSYAVEQSALTKFGVAMHPVMDNRSPAHTGMQVFNGPSVAKTGAGAAVGMLLGGIPGAILGGAVGAGGIDLAAHTKQESREPTEDEYNLMVDEMRLAYQKTMGQKAYERDVSEEERKRTNERVSRRDRTDMLVK